MSFEVRSISDIEHLRRAVELQQQIWGFADLELLPLRLFVVAQKIGGQVLGAFDGRRMAGFLVAIPGVKPGARAYLHSHMMGVLPEYRDRGVGRMLKLHQRDDALARGIDLVEWTFDPLELKNAFFNIERLGAVVRRYVLNQYGTTSSPLHGNLPTDRCVAEWHLNRTRKPAAVQARIEVPVEIARLRHEDPERAREIQRRVSDSFVEHFAHDLAAIGFERTERSGTYLLGSLG
jgi:predicted GNAT superfamily acetyltransferase